MRAAFIYLRNFIGFLLFFILLIIGILPIFFSLIFRKKGILSLYVKFAIRLLMIIFGLKTETINFDKELFKSRQWIVIGNHVSFLDPIILFLVFPGILRFMYKSGLDRLPIISSGLKAIGFISVDRKNPRKGQKAIIKAMEIIEKENDSIGIFPEGGRSITGKIRNFKRGAFVLAKENNIPILPVYLKGFYKAMPKGRNLIYPSKLIFEFLPPIEIDIIKKMSSEELRNYAYNIFIKKEKENAKNT